MTGFVTRVTGDMDPRLRCPDSEGPRRPPQPCSTSSKWMPRQYHLYLPAALPGGRRVQLKGSPPGGPRDPRVLVCGLWSRLARSRGRESVPNCKSVGQSTHKLGSTLTFRICGRLGRTHPLTGWAACLCRSHPGPPTGTFSLFSRTLSYSQSSQHTLLAVLEP